MYGWAGYSVDAGDVNGDGMDDVIIGAPEYETGAAYVVYGPISVSRRLDTADGRILGGDYEMAGSVASAGDTNGDGLDEVVINGDGAYLFLGPAAGQLTVDDADTLLDPPGSSAGFVAGNGDVDADGYADVSVSVPSTGAWLGTTYHVRGPFPAEVELYDEADAIFIKRSGPQRSPGRRRRGRGRRRIRRPRDGEPGIFLRPRTRIPLVRPGLRHALPSGRGGALDRRR